MKSNTKGILILAGIAAAIAAYRSLKRRRFAGIKLKRSIHIDRPARELYMFWRNLENLPRITDLLESVQVIDDVRSRWTVRAPGSLPVQWDAVITMDRKNEMVGWRSIPKSVVETAGYVRFEPAEDHGTWVRVALEYYPPAGRLGAAFASMFGKRPGAHITSLLRRFKQLMEAGEAAASLKPAESPGRPEDPARYLVR
jgi:uncharacterized membrane protein